MTERDMLNSVARAVKDRVSCRVWSNGDAAGHAADGRLLFVLLRSEQAVHQAGPVTRRPLLVVYETGTARIVAQLAGALVDELIPPP